jgi:hypothetical protein
MWSTTVGHVQIWNRGKPPRSIAVMKIARTHPDTTARHRSQRRRITTLVLSVVDTRTGTQHRVPIEAAALHRRSGRYPALCGIDVPAASVRRMNLTERGHARFIELDRRHGDVDVSPQTSFDEGEPGCDRCIVVRRPRATIRCRAGLSVPDPSGV